MNFFSPTKTLKEMLLLQHIEENPNTTQKGIARAVGGAPSTVNEYMEDLEERNLLIRDYKSAKVVHYNITPKGIKRKRYLSITYFHELLELYRLAEENIEKFLVGLEDKGYENILIYGAGEVAQTILGILKYRTDKSLKVVALIDDDKDRQNTEMLGYKIISREEIKDYKHDGIVITSYTFEDEIRKKLEEIDYPGDKIERFFTE
ncbi:winged helix-turn-helix transcriptional regulator [Asaccharospora irregularis]|uniref:C-methyltransferase C-terminal domain-containing protein n=1 Tax=Asaccharospora irregularis DSM 2635 TaxID=1121321 RepID=A0A1M5PG16_9FIRM|nr:winged helix-turn-helix transcriptional regulator [Asaccharospora irregularis]SHH00698.1 C-methyltransferase C-terminal domain-containing protein [Asaccharospora irregularis DSM 2635]